MKLKIAGHLSAYHRHLGANLLVLHHTAYYGSDRALKGQL